jgi:hypothetical protein
MQSITRFVETQLKLVVNRQKSRAAVLSACAFLGFEMGRGRIAWTEKAHQRFKERIQEITSRSGGGVNLLQAAGTKALRHGVAELFGDQPALPSGAGTGSMAATARASFK